MFPKHSLEGHGPAVVPPHPRLYRDTPPPSVAREPAFPCHPASSSPASVRPLQLLLASSSCTARGLVGGRAASPILGLDDRDFGTKAPRLPGGGGAACVRSGSGKRSGRGLGARRALPPPGASLPARGLLCSRPTQPAATAPPAFLQTWLSSGISWPGEPSLSPEVTPASPEVTVVVPFSPGARSGAVVSQLPACNARGAVPAGFWEVPSLCS